MTWKGFKDIQATIMVDIDKPEQEILNRVDRSRRKNINKALSEGLKFIEAKSEKDWQDWYKIYCKVWTEGGIDAQKLEIFQKPNHKLYLVKKGDLLLGGGVFEEFEDKIIFKAYASLIEYQDLRVNDFLYWSSIKYAKSKGKKKVDLGGWQINARGHLVGINTFKEKWGGEKVYYNIYSKNPVYILGRKAIRNSASARWVWDRIKRRPLPKSDKNTINKKSYETKESVNHFDLNLKGLFEIEEQLIKKYFKGKILDLGCGCGRTTKELFERGHDVLGVDIVKDMIKRAKSNYPNIKFEVGDACDLKFPDNHFDIVFFSYNGLDYIFPESKREKALREIKRVLKPGAYFIYSSHNPKALFFQFRPKFFSRNIAKGTLFSRYKYEKQNFGELYTFYGSPKKQEEMINNIGGMKLIEVVENNRNKLHPHYVFMKEG